MADRDALGELEQHPKEALRAARWLFFDLGETLLEETAALREREQRIAEALTRRGVLATPGDVRAALDAAVARFAARPFPEAVAALARGPEDAEAILAECPASPDLMPPFPEATGLLAALVSRYRLGVIANQQPGTEGRLARFGWDGLFRVVMASAEVGLEKPDPAIFRLAQERAGCPPHRIVMIGDRPDNDIAPARRLGWRTVRVRQGLHRDQAPRGPAEEADVTVDSLRALATLFGRDRT